MFGIGGIPQVTTAPAGAVNLTNRSASDVRQAPTNAVCDFIFRTNGGLRKFTGSAGTEDIAGEWKLDGVASDYEIWFESASGSAPNRGSALDEWHNMGEERSIGMLNTDDGGSTRSGTVTVKIRDVATETELDTCTLTLSATTVGVA